MLGIPSVAGLWSITDCIGTGATRRFSPSRYSTMIAGGWRKVKGGLCRDDWAVRYCKDQVVNLVRVCAGDKIDWALSGERGLRRLFNMIDHWKIAV